MNMQTDEQRKQFERVITSERFWRQPASKFDPTELLARDDVGGYTNGYIHERWRGWVEGQRARDAEVQALRKELGQLIDAIAVEEADVENLQRRVQSARAALAGGEEGEVE